MYDGYLHHMPIDLSDVALWRIFAVHYKRELDGAWELAPHAFADGEGAYMEENEIKRGSLGFIPSETRIYVYFRTELAVREAQSEVQPQIWQKPTFTLQPADDSANMPHHGQATVDITMTIPPTWERVARSTTIAYGGYSWHVDAGPRVEQAIAAVRRTLIQIADDLGNPAVVKQLQDQIAAEAPPE